MEFAQFLENNTPKPANKKSTEKSSNSSVIATQMGRCTERRSRDSEIVMDIFWGLITKQEGHEIFDDNFVRYSFSSTYLG